jgi:hypothetical protein
VPTDNDALGLKYYPLTKGKFIIYEVDSTIYTELPKDTIIYTYLIKEKIADSFLDNEGQPAIRLERYIKKYDANKVYDSIAWTIKEVWMINANKQSIQVVEGNVRYTKLLFPIQEKISWNGNAKNTIGEWLYTYDYIEKSESIHATTFDNVLKVKQKEYRTLISYENYQEKYAKNIGLVYREITNLLSNNILPNIPVEGRIESGIVYKQTYLTHGYE